MNFIHFASISLHLYGDCCCPGVTHRVKGGADCKGRRCRRLVNIRSLSFLLFFNLTRVSKASRFLETFINFLFPLKAGISTSPTHTAWIHID